MKWISTATLLMALGVGLSGSRATAQQASDQQGMDDVRARLEQQDRQIQQLQAQLAAFQPGTMATSAAYAPPEAGMATPAAPAGPPPCAVVGSDLSLKASLKDGLFLWFETPNKDFTMHLGGWMQYDNVFWGESPLLKSNAQGATAAGKPVYASAPAQDVMTGTAVGGFPLQDGTYFRRIRPFAEGTFWEFGEYRLILALENNTLNTSGLDEFWVGATKIPVIGTCRVGHVKTPMGLEGDMTASSRCMTFMERSSYSQAIELDQNFVTGIWCSNNYLDQHATLTYSVFRTDQTASTGAFFGTDQWGWQTRFTALPIYEDEGRHLLHMGVSGGWRSGAATGSITGPYTQTLASRAELRDDVPGTGATNADNNKFVSTGVIETNNDYLLGTEFLYIRGPLSFQGEYGWNFCDNVIGANPGATFAATRTPPGNYVFSGGYLQVAYMLTGENRAYDRKYGTLAREYLGHAGPNSPAWFFRDENGCLVWTPGAWEVAARFSYTDLNSGSGTGKVQGGIEDGFTLALNWYLNTNLTVMCDYVHNNRESVPTITPVSAATSAFPGHVDGFGARVQFQF
ncbi:MAG: porin [Thermoguttaceae bacterium]|jgi:phosphate-selective porin OprO/OprP